MISWLLSRPSGTLAIIVEDSEGASRKSCCFTNLAAFYTMAEGRFVFSLFLDTNDISFATETRDLSKPGGVRSTCQATLLGVKTMC